MVSKSIRMENWVEAYDGPVLLSDSFSNGGWGVGKGFVIGRTGENCGRQTFLFRSCPDCHTHVFWVLLNVISAMDASTSVSMSRRLLFSFSFNLTMLLAEELSTPNTL